MCGRFSVISDSDELEKRFGAKVVKGQYKKRYNAAPSQLLPVITNSDKKNVQYFKWGLIPFWAKEEKIGNRLINARAETITEKSSFKYAINKRRCLVIADGYYEWKTTEEGKIPFRITLKDGSLFAFAGIWETWQAQDGREIKSFAIITVPASNSIREIHDRMPAILTPVDEKYWIGDLPLTKVIELLKSNKTVNLKASRVSKLINSPSNDTEEVLFPDKH
ncbi:MAG: SOS response-associated peptidase [Fidelibacterota bacterium]